MDDPRTSPLFEGLGTWLVERGLKEASVEDIVQGFGRRLLDGGVSVSRVSLGGMLLHPVFGALDVVWDARSDGIRSQKMPRSVIGTDEFRNSPFFWMLENGIGFHRFELGAGRTEPEFPIFERFRQEGVTDYLVFFESYGRTGEPLWANLPAGIEGVLLALSTCRIGGFSDLEIRYTRALMRPLALSVKSITSHLLARELLDTYLGRYSGNRVLEGSVQRGDAREIECVLFFCDLRNSSELAERLPMDRYLALINDYFDCTAGSVADHGGEVLKFIGDAVMAIFPIEETTRPALDMRRAAITAAREAFARATAVNDRASHRGHAIEFGIALHIGRVMYGNVGTDRRLDFTTIGPAVNQVTRLEGLCKALGVPLVLSDRFAEADRPDLASLGRHRLAGMDRDIEVFTLPELRP